MPDPGLVPALFTHCEEVWNKMKEQSEKEQIDGVTLSVYRGHLTRLFTQELHLSVPAYTTVMRALKAMDCVHQIRRGGGGAQSEWAILQKPTREMFEFEVQKGSFLSTGKPKSTKLESIEQQIKDLKTYIDTRVAEVEAKIG